MSTTPWHHLGSICHILSQCSSNRLWNNLPASAIISLRVASVSSCRSFLHSFYKADKFSLIGLQLSVLNWRVLLSLVLSDLNSFSFDLRSSFFCCFFFFLCRYIFLSFFAVFFFRTIESSSISTLQLDNPFKLIFIATTTTTRRRTTTARRRRRRRRRTTTTTTTATTTTTTTTTTKTTTTTTTTTTESRQEYL